MNTGESRSGATRDWAGSEFPENAKRAVNDSQLRRNVRKATSTIRKRRAGLVAETPDWQQLRSGRRGDQGRRPATPRRLPRAVRPQRDQPRGATSTGPATPTRRRRSSPTLVQQTGHSEVIKVKSMATAGDRTRRSARARAGITAYETDLAELIIQLAHDRPSHIVVPALHRTAPRSGEIFLDSMDDAPRRPDRRPARARRGGTTPPQTPVPTAPRSPSAAPTSRSPRPAACSSPSPRATAACA